MVSGNRSSGMKGDIVKVDRGKIAPRSVDEIPNGIQNPARAMRIAVDAGQTHGRDVRRSIRKAPEVRPPKGLLTDRMPGSSSEDLESPTLRAEQSLGGATVGKQVTKHRDALHRIQAKRGG